MSSPVKVVSIVIPTLNEEEGVKCSIASIPKPEIQQLGYELEILVVDGNSSDFTREAAATMGAKVIVERRSGYGLACKRGLKAARGDIIVTMDGDGTYPGYLIPKCISTLVEKQLDFITINRLAKMEEGSMRSLHLIGNKMLASVMNLLYSINIHDSQSGMWIMKKSFIDNINLYSDEMSLSEEIKIIAFKFFRALEMDGTYSRRIGQAKLETISHGLNNFIYLISYKKLLKYAILNSRQEMLNPLNTVRRE